MGVAGSLEGCEVRGSLGRGYILREEVLELEISKDFCWGQVICFAKHWKRYDGL